MSNKKKKNKMSNLEMEFWRLVLVLDWLRAELLN
jgi:hypothetical protein